MKDIDCFPKVTSEIFDQLVTEEERVVIMVFYAPWAGPCHVIMPALKALETDHPHICFLQVNVDEQPEIARRYFAESLPLTVVLNHSILMYKMVGAKSLMTLKQKLAPWLQPN